MVLGGEVALRLKHGNRHIYGASSSTGELLLARAESRYSVGPRVRTPVQQIALRQCGYGAAEK
jgi:hypothetical protein